MKSDALPVGTPEAEYGINHNLFSWPDLKLQVEADRITDEGKCELYFYHVNGDIDTAGKPIRTLMYFGQANLLSSIMQREFIKNLSTRMNPSPDWQNILLAVARLTMLRLRVGTPANVIAGPPVTSKLHYLVHPLLEVDQPTTIYAPGASGKSYVADLVAVMVQFGIPLKLKHFTWRASKGNVLYLDWEGSQAGHERRIWAIKKGLGLDDADTDSVLFYRECHLPLVSDLANIQKLVHEAGILLVIIDSQMAASGYGVDAAQLASHFYNGVKSLGTTTLTLDHVNKSDWKGDESIGPYGSVVKYNRARSLFQMVKKQYPGEAYIDLAFQHKKHNEGLLLNPMGMRVSFDTDKDDPDTLLTVKFESIDPEDVLKTADIEGGLKPATIKENIEDALLDAPMSSTAIADKVGKPENTVRAILSRHTDMFKKTGEVWSLC